MKLKNRRGLLLIAVILVLVVASRGSDGDVLASEAKTRAPDYRKIIDEVLDDERIGVALLVRTPEFEYFDVRGYVDWENQVPLKKDHLFRIASCTKTFIATLATILHFEGKLDLDDTITSYLPDSITSHVEYADEITIRQLLSHTSGIFGINDNPEWWKAQFSDPTKERTDIEALEFAYDKPAYFEPGTRSKYTNTNYLLVGLILDKVLGYHHSQGIRTRILEPLELDSTFYEQHEEFDRTRLSHGYFDFEGDGIAEDYYDLRIDTGSASGALVSTAEDMELFVASLFTKGDFPDASYRKEFLQELTKLVLGASGEPGETGTGLGIMEYNYGYGKGYGHSGGTPGYASRMLYFPDRDVSFALTMNGIDGGFDQLRVLYTLYEDLIGATFSALGVEKTFDENIAGRLQAALDAAVEIPEANLPGVLFRVSSPELGTWSGAAGVSDIETNDPMSPDHKFRAASILKPFISVVVLQLVEENLFSLDDTLPALLPEKVTSKFRNSNKITVRMLLNHTSGIPRWLTGDVRAEIGANPRKVWKVEEYLDIASAQEPKFGPGKGWAYTNTEYNLIGLIIEEATGRSWREEIRERIIEPLDLDNTSLPEPGDVSLLPNHAHGYLVINGELVDYTATDPSMAGAAGGHAFATTIEDLTRFLDALRVGQLFQNPRTLGEMLTFVDTGGQDGYAGYGLGVAKWVLPGDIELLGHGGGTPGFSSLLGYLPAHDMTIALATTNMESGGGPVLGPALEILIPGFSLTQQPTQEGNVYEDPQGRFSIPLVGDWTEVDTDETYALLRFAEPPLDMYIVTAESSDLEAGIDAALRQIDIDPGALTLKDTGKFGNWNIFYHSLGDGKGVVILAQVKDETTYCLIGMGDEAITMNPPANLVKTVGGFTLAGEEVILPTTVQEFEAYINSFVGDKPPALSIAIALGSDVIYSKGFGMADGPKGMVATPDTVYQWGSMSKIVSATCIMQLYEKGLVDLDAPVSQYLDYFPTEYPITVRQVVSHSSGLPEPTDYVPFNLRLEGQPLPDPDLWTKRYLDELTGPIFEPGSTSAYSSPNSVILGQIVSEVTTGKPYIEYARENILIPLGMENTDFTYSSEAMIKKAASGAFPAADVEAMVTMMDEIRGRGDGADFIREVDGDLAWMRRFHVFAPAGGGLIGPATEVIRFLGMHLNGGEFEGVRILSPASVALMQEMQLSTKGTPLGFGLGWEVIADAEHPYVEHAGGGYGIQDLMRLYPNEGFAIAIMSNLQGYDHEGVVDAAANVVLSMLEGR